MRAEAHAVIETRIAAANELDIFWILADLEIEPIWHESRSG